MLLISAKDCRAYVEAELQHFVQSHPGWYSARSTGPQVPPLSWTLGQGDGSYALEARMDEQELLIWFGIHDVGPGTLDWIMRQAVHISFEDLSPRSDRIALNYRLADVLQFMASSLEAPMSTMFRFDLTRQALT